MSSSTRASNVLRLAFLLAAFLMLLLLAAPGLGLLFSSSPAAMLAGAQHPLFMPALWLSFQTTLISLLCVILLGTPLAWWLARNQGRKGAGLVGMIVDLPMIIPPAVIGLALLLTFGRKGLLGPILNELGVSIPFTTIAVVVAQVVVSAPFYIQAAAAAFQRVDEDILLVARTLGQSSSGAFFKVALPVALPGLLGGAALSWGRSLGEFGATLLFAGNLPGSTQTMPLAIYTALESDVRAALVISLLLAGCGVLVLGGLRLLPRWLPTGSRRESAKTRGRSS